MIWRMIWRFCEYWHIELGGFAPLIFERAIGIKGKYMGIRCPRCGELIPHTPTAAPTGKE